MKSHQLLSFALVLAASWWGGHCLGTNFNPENGTVVTREIGTTNVTFECVVVNDEGVQVTTQWNILNFRGVEGAVSILNALPDTILTGTPGGPFGTFRNILIFPEFIEDLDGTLLTCGTPSVGLSSGQFPLRVYRVPPLQNLTDPIRFPEGELGLVVTPEVGPTAHPFPSVFEWTASEGITIQNDSRRMFGYPSLTIDDVQRSDSGVYSLTATNRFLNESLGVLGSGAGSFTLDVLYGPEIMRGPQERAVRVGDPLMLLCGSNLDSNPRANVTWSDPAGQEVADNARYDLIQDEAGTVRLDFNTTIIGDMGTWTCDIRVEGVDVTQPGSLEVQPFRLIGVRTYEIMLYIVVAPGEPRNLTVDSIGATWANLCWQEPQEVGQPGIAFYTVIASGNNVVVNDSTADNSTRLNMTNLLPNVAYVFKVFAVAVALDVDNPSALSVADEDMTTVTVPAPVCNMATPGGGEIDFAWTFTHTGGLELTSLSVDYIFREGETNETLDGPTVELVSTSATISSLVAGFSYVPRVTATNSVGSRRVECPQVLLNVGIPQDPETPVVRDLSGGSVTVTVRTLTSGIRPGGDFYFLLNLTQLTVGDDGQPLTAPRVERMDVTDYINGEEVVFTVNNLVEGALYLFEVSAGNEFGRSRGFSFDTEAVLGGDTSANAGAIAGGVIGALIIVAIIVAIVVILIVVFLYIRPRNSYKPAASESRDELNVEGGGGGRVKVEELPSDAVAVDIGHDLSKSDAPKELHYAELESFRSPPSAEKTEELQSPKSVEAEKPVEYATIDTFRKTTEENPYTSEGVGASTTNV